MGGEPIKASWAIKDFKLISKVFTDDWWMTLIVALNNMEINKYINFQISAGVHIYKWREVWEQRCFIDMNFISSRWPLFTSTAEGSVSFLFSPVCYSKQSDVITSHQFISVCLILSSLLTLLQTHYLGYLSQIKSAFPTLKQTQLKTYVTCTINQDALCKILMELVPSFTRKPLQKNNNPKNINNHKSLTFTQTSWANICLKQHYENKLCFNHCAALISVFTLQKQNSTFNMLQKKQSTYASLLFLKVLNIIYCQIISTVKRLCSVK